LTFLLCRVSEENFFEEEEEEAVNDMDISAADRSSECG